MKIYHANELSELGALGEWIAWLLFVYDYSCMKNTLVFGL